MRRFATLLTLCLAATPAAADEPKPNMVTPAEIAEGRLLLFDGATTFGWKTQGDAKVADGALVLGGDQASVARFAGLFHEFELTFEYRSAKGFTLEAWPTLEKPTGSGWLRRGLEPSEGKEWAHASFTLRTGQGTVQMRGVKGFERKQQFAWPGSSPVYLAFGTPAKATASVRNVKLRPLGLEPIFNGRDLTGWKPFETPPRNKSQFTVRNGELHVKNGPGDLQTEGKWADFVLQLECRSNGKHLNSGVFFRCLPGDYQQGYEAQIHNAFTEEPMKEYTLEEYDPQTHQRVGKKKLKYQAIDYGTGAIYRRQPARRPASQDFEWFTMTVEAHGRHMLVWVNGILVTDWNDNRPPNENGRNGCRLEAGAISLQGHDPTTDLSFRNLRIAELPPAAADQRR
jgi:Domain of Unknown Function (DUF1080)